MPLYSKPISDKAAKRFKLNDAMFNNDEGNVKCRRIGKMFDDIQFGKRKIPLTRRIYWKWIRFKDFYYDTKQAIRNHLKWHFLLRSIRSWAGYDGMINVMITQLHHYIDHEKKYNTSEESHSNHVINSASKTIAVLKRLRNPINYSSRRRKKVEARYPKYKSLITEYKDGGSCHNGRFVAQGNGWVGVESGKDPREGYFEFVGRDFILTDSPDQVETDRLLTQLYKYNEEIDAAYAQAKIDEEKDFDKLASLLKENMYSWWD